jgi:BCD family chlorophyll transporter-like MFS transporter
LVLEQFLRDFTPLKLIQVIQGTAVFTVICNAVSLWKQEARVRGVVEYTKDEIRPRFRDAWRTFAGGGQAIRLLVASGIGFFAFNLQDVLLEPYGGEILHLTVSQTTMLTAIMAAGAVAAFGLSAAMLRRQHDPIRVAALGVLGGIIGFAMIVFASPLDSPTLFRAGVALIGFGEGLFGVGTLSFAMQLKDASQHGIALGAWGAVFATAEGLSFALSGLLKDWLSHLVERGALGPGLSTPAVPYSVVYHLEIFTLFATLVALGPLVARRMAGRAAADTTPQSFGLADLPA